MIEQHTRLSITKKEHVDNKPIHQRSQRRLSALSGLEDGCEWPA